MIKLVPLDFKTRSFTQEKAAVPQFKIISCNFKFKFYLHSEFYFGKSTQTSSEILPQKQDEDAIIMRKLIS